MQDLLPTQGGCSVSPDTCQACDHGRRATHAQVDSAYLRALCGVGSERYANQDTASLRPRAAGTMARPGWMRTARQPTHCLTCVRAALAKGGAA
jgi:hypothetical protein